MPIPVAHLRSAPCGVHDVGEQHRGEHPIIDYVGLLTREELGDLLERRAPVGFVEVNEIAPRKFDEFRAWYAISDILAPLGRDHPVVCVMQDKCRDAD